jgi:uncharacterized membrane protein YbhN (UPF0104 family)
MPKLWTILGILSLLAAVFFYYYQEIHKHAHWNWSQFINMEMATSLAAFVGMALLLVALVEYLWKRLNNRGK